MMKNSGPLVLILCLIFASTAWGQASPFPDSNVQTVYQRLLPQIEQIRIFDNHGHPGFPDDADVDAMAIPSDSSVPFRLRADNAELLDAAKALFDYPYTDFSPDHLRLLIDKKAEAKRHLGVNYFSHLLDQVGIETAVANSVSMPPYLAPSRFRWVVFVDSFLFPFDTQQMESRDADQKLNLPLQQKLLRRELTQAHLERLPADFHGYLEFIRTFLETSRKSGAVGIKFEVAYFRSLHFDDPSEQRAAVLYAKYRAGGVPQEDEYRES
jgi:hypothetical protein